MRELPEVEVLRRDLEREFVGKKIRDVEAHSMKIAPDLRTRKQLSAALEGRKLKSVERRGTLLVLTLDDGHAAVIDLGPAGLLLKAKTSRAALPKDTQLVLRFSVGGEVRVVDSAGGASLRVVPLESLEAEHPRAGRLGIDPLELTVSWQAFGQLLAERSETLKALLVDESLVAGIGPVYSDEILFASGLRHDRAASALTAQEVRRLYRGTVEVLQEAVKHRGTTLDGDDGFVDLFGNPGSHQEHLQVYGREGEPCPRCRKPIRKTRAGRLTTFWSESQV